MRLHHVGIVVNSIDNDGQMKGYDLELAISIRKAIRLPLTVLGGAGSLADIGRLIEEMNNSIRTADEFIRTLQ